MKRITFSLNSGERAALSQLKPIVGEAFAFWEKIAKKRNLDYRTLLCNGNGEYSALTRGDNPYWCYPFPLQCKERPVYNE